MLDIRFEGWDCELEFGYYENGQTAMQLFDKEDGSPVLVATVAVDEDIRDGEVVIKDYSENKGILDVLIEAGVISNPIRFIPSGYVMLPVCRLLIYDK